MNNFEIVKSVRTVRGFEWIFTTHTFRNMDWGNFELIKDQHITDWHNKVQLLQSDSKLSWNLQTLFHFSI